MSGGELHDVHAVVLVEGTSDRAALEALASKEGRDLAAEGVAVVAVGGAQGMRRHLDAVGPRGRRLRLAGLCDPGEEPGVRRALEGAGFGGGLTRERMEALGFGVCVLDLEDELIRALGAAAVVELVEAEGDLRAFRTLQKQAAWRGRPVEEQLRRFFGSGGRRKIRYAPLLVRTLDADRVPRPLRLVLAHV
jgi:hypothetical protein